jgi:mRNA interferase MazF
VIFEAFSIVVVPFPFLENATAKNRPAVILTSRADFGAATEVATIAMITTAASSHWPFDVPIGDLQSAGLKHRCVIRMKFATMTYDRFSKQLGILADDDRVALNAALAGLLGIAISGGNNTDNRTDK